MAKKVVSEQGSSRSKKSAIKASYASRRAKSTPKWDNSGIPF